MLIRLLFKLSCKFHLPFLLPVVSSDLALVFTGPLEILLFNDDFPLTTTFGDLPVPTPVLLGFAIIVLFLFGLLIGLVLGWVFFFG